MVIHCIVITTMSPRTSEISLLTKRYLGQRFLCLSDPAAMQSLHGLSQRDLPQPPQASGLRRRWVIHCHYETDTYYQSTVATDNSRGAHPSSHSTHYPEGSMGTVEDVNGLSQKLHWDLRCQTNILQRKLSIFSNSVIPSPLNYSIKQQQ